MDRAHAGVRVADRLVDWELAVALLTYAAASASDYLLTLSGLMGREVRELNPLLNTWIACWGAEWGLLIPKVLIGVTAVTASSLYLQAMYRRRKTRIRPQHILYPGAVLTAFVPLHWVVLKVWQTLSAGPVVP